jgi:hypothetical protein
MRNRFHHRTLLGMSLLVLIGASTMAQRAHNGVIWAEPPVVTPGEGSGPPADAIVLFDGKGFDSWDGAKGWKVDPDGGFTVKGRLRTKQRFGDCQLHLEFATPKEVKGSGQGRGNNGVGLMGAHYEIQILDSYNNKTYPVGQCAAVYNQKPPLVNASRKPGEWQTYDIIFSAPRFDKDGKLHKPAYVTVLHNGLIVQNHTEIRGDTADEKNAKYRKVPDKLPLVLMYHGNPVRFRNIWIRELKELDSRAVAAKT